MSIKSLDMPWKWTVENDDNERNNFYDDISRAACKYISQNSTIYINTGTTGNMMVKYLPNIEFTLVTNSILIANAAYKKCPMANIVVIGGKLRERGVCDDDITLQQLAFYNFDYSFITGEGFSKDGLSNSSKRTALLHNTIINVTNKNILLLPYFKLNQKGIYKTTDVDKIDVLITNRISKLNYCTGIIKL